MKPPSLFRLSSSLAAIGISTSLLSAPVFLNAQSRNVTNASIVVEARHQKILISENADARLPVGDLTKVATAAVALDWLVARGGNKNDLMVVPYSIANLGAANFLGMQAGDQITVRDALFAMLLASDNAAALTIADYFGRQMMAEAGGIDPVAVFVGQMNALSSSEEMSKTEFVNPHGLEQGNGPIGLSTAKDMARLVLYVSEIPEYNFIQAQSKRRISYLRGQQRRAFDVRNTNYILGSHGVQTGKAGATRRSGQCLVTFVHLPDKIVTTSGGVRRRIPYRLVTVTLNSPNNFGHTAHLIDKGWSAYETWLAKGLIVRDPAEEMLRTTSLASR